MRATWDKIGKVEDRFDGLESRFDILETALASSLPRFGEALQEAKSDRGRDA